MDLAFQRVLRSVIYEPRIDRRPDPGHARRATLYRAGRRHGGPKSALMSAPAPPPKPGSTEHWQAWLQRYGGDYTDDAERRAAWDFTTNLDTIQPSSPNPMTCTSPATSKPRTGGQRRRRQPRRRRDMVPGDPRPRASGTGSKASALTSSRRPRPWRGGRIVTPRFPAHTARPRRVHSCTSETMPPPVDPAIHRTVQAIYTARPQAT